MQFTMKAVKTTKAGTTFEVYDINNKMIGTRTSKSAYVAAVIVENVTDHPDHPGTKGRVGVLSFHGKVPAGIVKMTNTPWLKVIGIATLEVEG